ncbi:MAG: dTDP-4-dehydrorhamnose 3,5-epimerase [Planctomycetota bacterium]|jgi:dTDP-4-dehydrorhamnose 3,5-epimerase
MNVVPTSLPGVLILEPPVFRDGRGFFLETWRAERYAVAGLPTQFVQDNVSRSGRGVLRGLHFQCPTAQGKLVTVLEGEVFDVAVDIRAGSPTFGRWAGVTLTGAALNQFWIPPGFAHGFCVTSETALFAYKCTAPYRPEHEGGVAWDDPAVGIAWPLGDGEAPQLSDRDRAWPPLAEADPATLPQYADFPDPA